MKEGWTNKWKKILIWLSGYINFIAFAVVGGYAIVKEQDEELKKTAKKVFVITLIFTAISAVLSLISYFGGMADGYYGSGFYKAMSIIGSLVNIAKVVVYAIFIIIELLAKEDNSNKKVIESDQQVEIE